LGLVGYLLSMENVFMSPRMIKTGLFLVLLVMFVAVVVSEFSTYDKSTGPEVRKRSFEITYNVKVDGIVADANEVKVWIPLPVGRKAQKLHFFRVAGDTPYQVLTEPKYGNNYLVFDLDETGFSRLAAGGLEVVFAVTRYQDRPLESSWRGNGEDVSKQQLEMYLAPNRLVPISGKIADEAKRVAGHMKGTFAQSKVLYEHIVNTVSYDKRGSGWGRGDALYACDVRKGNCTDYHSLYIAELRSLGIPARFISGFGIPEGVNHGEVSYHCWAQFYIDGKGWLPVDASQADTTSERLENCFAELDEHRVAFTIGRDIKLPGSSGEPVNYSIYPSIEIDGVTYDEGKTRISFKDMQMPQEGIVKNKGTEALRHRGTKAIRGALPKPKNLTTDFTDLHGL
jgi:transglutaminase-like putative cysteine protease